MTTIIAKSAPHTVATTKLGGHRKIFDSLSAALITLKAIYASEGFPAAYPVVAARIGAIDVSGENTIPPLSEWPLEYLAEGVSICVTMIGIRGLADPADATKKVNGGRGFAIYPLHSLDSIQADVSGVNWLLKVVEKEASHVALRNLRNVSIDLGIDALAQAAQTMPVSVADYVTESESDAMDTSFYDAMFADFRKIIAGQASTSAIAKMLPSKPETLKAIRSKDFATREYQALENMGAFVWIAEKMIGLMSAMNEAATAAGEEAPFESGDMQSWLAGRDTKVYAVPKKVEADLSTVNLSAFVLPSFTATPATAPTTTSTTLLAPDQH